MVIHFVYKDLVYAIWVSHIDLTGVVAVRRPFVRLHAVLGCGALVGWKRDVERTRKGTEGGNLRPSAPSDLGGL
jgi:hypothetical protein